MGGGSRKLEQEKRGSVEAGQNYCLPRKWRVIITLSSCASGYFGDKKLVNEWRDEAKKRKSFRASPVYLCALFGWNSSSWRFCTFPLDREKRNSNRCPTFLWSLWRAHCLLTQTHQPEASHTLLSDGRCCIPGFIIIFSLLLLICLLNFALRVPSHALVPHIKISMMIFGFNK